MPDALVLSPEDDDLLAQLWRERLCNQKPIEVLILTPFSASARHECRRRSLYKAHGLLVKLCPEARERLDQRLQTELRRCQPLVRRNESLASR